MEQSYTNLIFTFFRKEDNWHFNDEFHNMEVALIPPPRKRRGLVNRTLWETLRSTVFQGVLKKSGGASLFSAVLQAARAQNNPNDQSAEAKAARIGECV